MNKKHIDQLFLGVNELLTNGGKTDLDSQIKYIENLQKNLINTPMFISVIASLKELRGIKKNSQ